MSKVLNVSSGTDLCLKYSFKLTIVFRLKKKSAIHISINGI